MTPPKTAGGNDAGNDNTSGEEEDAIVFEEENEENLTDDTEVETPASAYDEYAEQRGPVKTAGGDTGDSPSPEEMSIEHKIENLPGILLDEEETEETEEEDGEEEASEPIAMPSAESTPPTNTVGSETATEGHMFRNIVIVILLIIVGLYVWGRQIVLQEQQEEAVQRQQAEQAETLSQGPQQ